MVDCLTQNLKQKEKKKKDPFRVDKKESERHYKAKLRLYQIFRDYGFQATCERRLPVFVTLGNFTVKYRSDVFATRGKRQIIAEVDGYTGHKSARAKLLQVLRLRRIRETYGTSIEEYRFTLKRLSAWSDKEIAEEMRLE